MATPCRVAFFVMRRCTTPRTGGGEGGARQPPNLPTKGRGRPNTTPRPHNSTCQQPATNTTTTHEREEGGGDLTPPRDRTTALASNLRQTPQLPTKGRGGRPNTTPRPHNSTRHHPATAQQHLPATRKFCSSAKNIAKNVAVSRKFLTFVL